MQPYESVIKQLCLGNELEKHLHVKHHAHHEPRIITTGYVFLRNWRQYQLTVYIGQKWALLKMLGRNIRHSGWSIAGDHLIWVSSIFLLLHILMFNENSLGSKESGWLPKCFMHRSRPKTQWCAKLVTVKVGAKFCRILAAKKGFLYISVTKI